MGNAPRSLPHGTWNAYVNHGCRCERCKKASAKHRRDLREKKKLAVQSEESGSIPHGTRSGYAYHLCRCDACKTAHSDYRRNLQPHSSTPHGTISGYVNHRCRCQQCRDAFAALMREQRADLQAAGKCRTCGKIRDGKSKVYCVNCHNKVKERLTRTRLNGNGYDTTRTKRSN